MNVIATQPIQYFVDFDLVMLMAPGIYPFQVSHLKTSVDFIARIHCKLAVGSTPPRPPVLNLSERFHHFRFSARRLTINHSFQNNGSMWKQQACQTRAWYAMRSKKQQYLAVFKQKTASRKMAASTAGNGASAWGHRSPRAAKCPAHQIGCQENTGCSSLAFENWITMELSNL